MGQSLKFLKQKGFNSMDKRIYIIGGNGFLGSKLKTIFKQSNINYTSLDISTTNDSDNYFDITSSD